MGKEAVAIAFMKARGQFWSHLAVACFSIYSGGLSAKRCNQIAMFPLDAPFLPNFSDLSPSWMHGYFRLIKFPGMSSASLRKLAKIDTVLFFCRTGNKFRPHHTKGKQFLFRCLSSEREHGFSLFLFPGVHFVVRLALNLSGFRWSKFVQVLRLRCDTVERSEAHCVHCQTVGMPFQNDSPLGGRKTSPKKRPSES